jgi:hypothetical protein
MINISFDELAERLPPEALDLFRKMAAAHVESTGDRLFIRADSWGGPGMIFRGQGSSQHFDELDAGALEDLISWDLLHTDVSPKGTPNYRVTGEAVRFFQWLEQSQSSATPPEDTSDAGPGLAAGVAVLPLERSREYPDDQSRQVVLGAVESMLRELAPYRDPETTPLDPDEWAEVDTNCRTLESQLRHPRGGNPTIIAAATDDAIRAVRPHLDLNNVDPEVSELLTAVEGIGDPDPAEAGRHAESVIDHVTEHPPARTTTPPPPPIDAPAGEPGDKPTDPADTQRYIDRAKEAAQEGSLRGVDSGVEKLIQNLIVGSPAAIAAATKVLAGWMIAGTHGAAAGVAWAVIRIVIGSFKNRRPLPVG